MLDHPLIFRDSIKELDKPQNMYKTTIKVIFIVYLFILFFWSFKILFVSPNLIIEFKIHL